MSPSNWKQFAVCTGDSRSFAWFSFKKEDIDYAKNGCAKCTARIPCFLNAWESEEYCGVNGGISEFEFLLSTWKEAKKVTDENWKRSDKDLQKFVRRVS